MFHEGTANQRWSMDLNLSLSLTPSTPSTPQDLTLNPSPSTPPFAAESDPDPPSQDHLSPAVAEPVIVPVEPPPSATDEPHSSTPLPVNAAADFGPYLPVLVPSSASQQDARLDFPRQIESDLRLFRSLMRSRDEERSFSPPPRTYAFLIDEMIRSQRVLEATRSHLEEEVEDKSRAAANFDCNICLELSKDPVVTSCGHLFCWPCLYQWLHLHSDHSECPVCKGHVDEAKLTPIYGRGGVKAVATVEDSKDDQEIGLEIPPRPHGHRVESLRQHLHRTVSRRFDEVSPTSWNHILDEENANLRSVLDGARHMIQTRLREWRMQRREGNHETGMASGGLELPSNDTPDLQIDTVTSLQDEVNHFRLSSLHNFERFVQAGAATSSVMPTRPSSETALASEQASASNSMVGPRGEHYLGGSSRPLRRRGPATPASEQASASNSMVGIQGEQYPAGSSRPIRRRGWSDIFDIDEGEFRACKRRRLN